MATESRPETCTDCGAQRNREWVVRTVHVLSPVPPGFRVERRTGEIKVIAGRTQWRTLCLCDVP